MTRIVQPRRSYDTVDPDKTAEVARKHGLRVIHSEDLGDQYSVTLKGTIEQHEAFMAVEGYSQDDWERGRGVDTTNYKYKRK